MLYIVSNKRNYPMDAMLAVCMYGSS